MADFPGCSDGRTDEAELFAAYLDFFRASVEEKLRGLADADLRGSRLPSGWSPIELAQHLAFMERRWLQWGFRGRDVDEPWGDDGPDGRWRVPAGTTLDDVVGRLHAEGRRTTALLAEHDLDEVAPPGPRFEGYAPPTLRRILFHVLQEYARHVGHLDVARELVDGATGE